MANAGEAAESATGRGKRAAPRCAGGGESGRAPRAARPTAAEGHRGQRGGEPCRPCGAARPSARHGANGRVCRPAPASAVSLQQSCLSDLRASGKDSGCQYGARRPALLRGR